MLTLRSANSFYDSQKQIAATTVGVAQKLWRRVGDDFSGSWMLVAPAILEAVQLGRAASAVGAVGYTAAVLEETGQVAPAAGELNTSRFLATAPNGQDMRDVLDGAVTHAKVAVKGGATSTAALAQTEAWLTGVLLTVMADTRRSIIGADIAQRPALNGYVRMLNAPSCSRCVILAGKWFRWNSGFQRHPRCDCLHVATTNEAWAKDEGFISDPYEYFNSLSAEAQETTFGRIEARAIRDGADIYRIENTRLRGLGTAKGRARYGTPTRLTVDDIYRQAGTRTNAIRMMEQEGYITGPQVRGGNILGQREGFGQLGKGGRARAATDAVTNARATGVRDPLNRYTMTSAERRLYDAKYRLDVARTGVYPRSIGQNTADMYVAPRAITPTELATIEKVYRNEVDRLYGNPVRGIAPAGDSVQTLARALGIL